MKMYTFNNYVHIENAVTITENKKINLLFKLAIVVIWDSIHGKDYLAQLSKGIS